MHMPPQDPLIDRRIKMVMVNNSAWLIEEEFGGGVIRNMDTRRSYVLNDDRTFLAGLFPVDGDGLGYVLCFLLVSSTHGSFLGVRIVVC
jgi:hypothetical protein